MEPERKMEPERRTDFAEEGDLPRRAYLRRAAIAALGAGVAAAFLGTASESGESEAVDVEALLLAPEDVPEAGLRSVRRLGRRKTRDGGLAAQTILEADRVRIFQGVVAFPSERAARAALRGIRESGEMRGRQATEQPRFGEESLVLAGWRDGGRSIAAVFREGRLLVRLTLVGAAGPAELVRYARKAAEKTKRAAE